MSRADRLRAWLRRPEAALFALVLGAYAYFYQAGGWNQNSRFDLVRTIVEDGSSRIDRLEKNTGDDSKRAGHYYCDKAPGVQWLAVPPYALVHALAGPPAKVKPSPAYLAWSTWLVTIVAVGIPSAIAAVMLALLLRAFGVRAGPAVVAAAAYALATLAWPYGTLFYGHQTLAALLLIGFAVVAIPRARREVASPTRLFVAGLVLGYAVVVEYPGALACAVIGVYAIVVHGWRRTLWLVAGAVPPAIALAAYHWIVFGGPATLPYQFSTQPHRHMGWFMGLGAPRPVALWHILLSSYRGLFFSSPWLLIAIPGAVVMARRGRGAEAAVCGAVFVLFVWLNASLVDWQGGWTMGARYLVPCIPFLAILAAGMLVPTTRGDAVVPVAARRFDDGSREAGDATGPAPRPLPPPSRAPRWIAGGVVGALLAWSFALMLIGTAVKPEVPVWFKHPYGDYLWPRFRAGALSVSTQSIDMPGHPDRGPRQAWNLGQKLGLRGHASLAPLALWLLGLGALAARAARRDDT